MENVLIGQSSSNNINFNYNPNTTTTSFTYQYLNGKIVSTKIFEDRIEVIYRCEPIYHTYPGTNYPKIYKEIYSRTNGTMERVEGKYVPEQFIEEDYEF